MSCPVPLTPYVYCNGREFYDARLGGCPNDGYRHALADWLCGVVLQDRRADYDRLIDSGAPEDHVLDVLLVREEGLPGVMPDWDHDRARVLDLVEERNRRVLEVFPDGALARELRRPPERVDVSYVRSARFSGVLLLARHCVFDVATLDYHGLREEDLEDPARPRRTLSMSPGWPSLIVDEATFDAGLAYDTDPAHLRPHVPIGYI